MNNLILVVFIWFTSFSISAQDSLDVSTLEFLKTKEKSYQKIDSFFKDKTFNTNQLDNLILQAQKFKAPEITLYCKLKLGIILRDKSLYQDALKINNEVLKISEKLQEIEFKIVALNMQGVIYRRLDSVQLAINYHQKALDLAENKNPKSEIILRNIAISCNSIGNVYLTLNQFDLAKEKFEKSIAIEKKIGNNLGLAINYHNIGGIYEKKNQLDKALEQFYFSLNYNRIINSDLGKLICHNSIGQVFLKQNKIDKAEYYLKDVLNMAGKTGDDFYISTSNLNIGWLHLEKGNIKLAREHLLKCISIAEKRNLQSALMEGYRILSKIEEKDNNNQLALAYFKQYQKIKEAIVSEKNLKFINELNTRYNTKQRQTELKLLKQENNFVKERLKNTYLYYFVGILLALLFMGIIYIFQRQKQLGSEKKLLLMEQKMFRAQLNPHFIFNALNSIKSYIIKNEKDNAVYYLNKFSKLFNVILSGINEKDVSLAEELKIIEIYINLENIRFENDIKFTLSIEKDLDIKHIKVPSLILQPYVENAIWHGLNSKKGEKKLNINVKKVENHINIIIEDNGIGRIKAQEIKKLRATKRESFGQKLTEERLQSYYQKAYSLQIIDLYNQENQPTGTQVILKIPYQISEV